MKLATLNPVRLFKRWWSLKLRWRIATLSVAFAVFTVTSVEVTSQNWFCNSCHIMNPYYASWKSGSHADVNCTQCHIPPGFGNFVSAKLNGLGQVVDDVLDRTSSKPSAAVSDASCTRSGCHSTDKLRADGLRKEGRFLFDHGKHLGKEYDGIEIHCTTCHSHVEGNSHFKVNTNACVTCHLARPQSAPAVHVVDFLKGGAGTTVAAGESVVTVAPSAAGTRAVTTAPAEAAAAAAPTAQTEASLVAAARLVAPEKVAPNSCKNCHEAPQKEFTYRGLKVVHSEYLAYGAACESCHSGVTAKPQPVRDDHCFNCHEFGKERFTTSAETHHIHTAGAHKVECLSCHGVTAHGPKAQAVRMDRLECESCHTSQHSVQQITYKKLELGGPAHGIAPPAAGEPSQNLPAVSPMFMAHVDCTACHVEQKPLTIKPTSGATVAKASARSCDTCHKHGLGEQLVPLWQKNTRTLFDASIAMLPAEDAAAALAADQAKRVSEARQLLELVRVDGSWGVHNPRYTQKILEDAQQKLADLPRPKEAPKPKSVK